MKKEVKRTTKFIVCMSALFCCLFFAGTVSKASQVQPTVTPSPRRVPLTRVLLRSGIYTYQVTNEKEKRLPSDTLRQWEKNWRYHPILMDIGWKR